ncbi:MAG TPA: DUF5679 domain-containing protein, partial [Aggregatilineales bacterium]|nr:DUF5679 domain-containing protein [Aggregatilineales bacterium]
MEDFEDLLDEPEPIEAYCVSCKEKVEMEEPVAVWTSKGQAATRGFCSVCGNNVFRMGRTYLHSGIHAPKAIQVIPAGAKGRAARAAYIAAAVTDAEFVQHLAEDIRSMGINVWIDDGTQEVDLTQWAGGVHPALEQCTHLIVVLSGFTENTGSVQAAWEYFLKQRKPVAIVKIEDVEP